MRCKKEGKEIHDVLHSANNNASFLPFFLHLNVIHSILYAIKHRNPSSQLAPPLNIASPPAPASTSSPPCNKSSFSFSSHRPRLMARNGLTAEEADKRIGAQMANTERVAKADRVIWNNGTLEELEAQVLQLWKEDFPALANITQS
uniref:Dephospho-CoA kinase n=1 Tax=Heterosigma akashiwo TaxID=2829 RepID=A0A7S3XRE6_HETAK